MNLKTLLLSFVFLWFVKSTSLPKLYYRLSNRRGLDVQKFRKLEKLALKVTKWKLDIKYFEDCDVLGVCPKLLSRERYQLLENI